MKTLKLPYSGLEAIQDDNPVAFPTLDITENGVYNVKGYAYADVNVSGSEAPTQLAGVIPAGDYVLQYNSVYDIYELNAVQLEGASYDNINKTVYFVDGINPRVTRYFFTSGDYTVTILRIGAGDEIYGAINVDGNNISDDIPSITVTLPYDVQCYVATDELIELFPEGRLLDELV